MNTGVKRKKRIHEGSPIATIIIYIVVSIACFVTLYPFYYVFIQSIADPNEVVTQSVYLWPKKYYFGSYTLILSDPKMWRAYKYTILYVFSGTVLNIITSCLGAYPLALKVWHSVNSL